MEIEFFSTWKHSVCFEIDTELVWLVGFGCPRRGRDLPVVQMNRTLPYYIVKTWASRQTEYSHESVELPGMYY